MEFRRNARAMAVIALSLVLLVASAAAQTRDDRWRQDLQYIATQLPAVHANFYFHVSPSDFQQAVSALDAAIPSLPDSTIIARLAALVALAGDTHTSLGLTQPSAGYHQYPLALTLFDDGLYVTKAQGDYRQVLGTRVLRIGNKSAEEAFQAVVPLISHENDAWPKYMAPILLGYAEVLYAVGLADSAAGARFQFQRSTGETITLDVPQAQSGVAWLSLPDPNTGFVAHYRRNTSKYYWYESLQSLRTFYFAYNMAADMASEPFSTFAARMMDAMTTGAYDRLVIDFRNNPGGNTQIFYPLLQTWTNPEVRAQIPPRIYVLIGRNTASTAIIHAIQLRDQLGALLVGEPTGGKPNSYGNTLDLYTPNSRLRIIYSTRFYNLQAANTDSLMLAMPVGMRSADFFARHDPCLAALLASEGGTQ